MVRSIETVIVGGVQAGLATSYYLTQLGREHIILEKEERIVSGWRNGRWDSFCQVTPNWTVRMPGAALVVGSGQSRAQIAEELYQAGRKVYLATGSCGRSPRSYRGRDIFEWLYRNGFLRTPVDKLPSPKAKFASAPHFTGKGGGSTLNLHTFFDTSVCIVLRGPHSAPNFYRGRVTLLGHARDYQDGKLVLAPDLKENLAKAVFRGLAVSRRPDHRAAAGRRAGPGPGGSGDQRADVEIPAGPFSTA